MSDNTARAILDDLFHYEDTALIRYDRDGEYCVFCRVGDNRGEIAHLDACPYTRYRKMAEEEK